MDISIVKLTPADTTRLDQLLDIYTDVFAMTGFVRPPTSYLLQLLQDPTVTVFVALHDQKVVGGLTAYTLSSLYEKAKLLYLYDLGISPAWQRQGVGTKLIRGLLEYCAGEGISEVFVQADLPDTHAISFYTKNGGIREDVIHFSFSLIDYV
jgi:aminoglycoside 3-N-acetyltransferase I